MKENLTNEKPAGSSSPENLTDPVTPMSNAEALLQLHQNMDWGKHFLYVVRESDWNDHVDHGRFHEIFKELPAGLQRLLIDLAIAQWEACKDSCRTYDADEAETVFLLMDQYNILPFSPEKIRKYIWVMYLNKQV